VTAEVEMLCGFQYTFGPSKDYHQAFALFRHAADQESANGEYSVAQSYEAGEGVEKDEAKAVVWYRKAAEHGPPAARARLKKCSFAANWYVFMTTTVGNGEDSSCGRRIKNHKRSLAPYAAAAQGDADTKDQLGIDYFGVVTLGGGSTQLAGTPTKKRCNSAINEGRGDHCLRAERDQNRTTQ